MRTTLCVELLLFYNKSVHLESVKEGYSCKYLQCSE